MTINEWLKSMALAGFDGKFEATNGQISVRGYIENGIVKVTDKR